MKTVHRKLVHRWHEAGHAHELTFSCFKRQPLLLQNDWPILLSRSIDSAMVRHQCELTAFVFMPEHVHLLILPTKLETAIGEILAAIKRPFSYRVKRKLMDEQSPLLDELTVRERPGKTTFRFWQEGGGYDRNIHKWDAINRVAEYVHLNPVRRSLCDDPVQWKWSSYRHYECPNDPIDPDLPKIGGLPT